MIKNIQFYVDVDAQGEIINAQMGVNIVATDPFPFFFMIDEEQAERISAKLSDFKVEIANFRPQLIEKEAAAE